MSIWEDVKNDQILSGFLGIGAFFAIVLLVCGLCYLFQMCLENSIRREDPEEIIVIHDGIPITLQLIVSQNGRYYRILDEYQAMLLNSLVKKRQEDRSRITDEDSRLRDDVSSRPPPYCVYR